MSRCPKCGRGHSGVCGIPPGVTLGFGARMGGVSGVGRDTATLVSQGKPKRKSPSTAVLESLLAHAREHQGKVQDMLAVLPAELPEYVELLDRESRLNAIVRQLIGQIAARKGV